MESKIAEQRRPTSTGPHRRLRNFQRAGISLRKLVRAKQTAELGQRLSRGSSVGTGCWPQRMDRKKKTEIGEEERRWWPIMHENESRRILPLQDPRSSRIYVGVHRVIRGVIVWIGANRGFHIHVSVSFYGALVFANGECKWTCHGQRTVANIRLFGGSGGDVLRTMKGGIIWSEVAVLGMSQSCEHDL